MASCRGGHEYAILSTSTTDPITSHLAVEEVTKSGRRESNVAKVMVVVREEPGLVAHEIAPRAGPGRC